MTRRNTLNITWSGGMLSAAAQNQKESFRCNSLKAANRVLDRRNKNNISAAIYTDNNGKKTKLI